MCFGCTALIVIFVLYMQNVAIPLPKCSKRSNKQPRSYFRIFQLLPILIAVLLIWIVSTILTSAGVFTSDKEDPSFLARSDAKLDIIYRSPWIQITYPGQFGLPKFHLALTLGFLVAFIASMMESVGDYYAAQVVCGVPRPPTHAISRGILMEGLGSVLSGAVGAGHATTSYSGNIAVLSLTKTASRIVMYTAGMMLIGLSLIGKAGAALTAIPNPIIGGILMVVVGTLISIGLSNLKHVDMTSSRNMLVVGVPFMAGIVMPRLLDSHPDVLDTGSEEANRILSVILGTPMFLGGMLALILDSTVPGTLESRGMGQNNHEHGHSEDESGENTDMLYSWPFYRRLCRFCPWLGHLPFLPGNSTVQLSDKHFNGKQKNGDSHAI
ncbi:solute carrier family 23 member 1 [Aplysia californica]|uniref:Solute carrier family 23 member 1 n=1 Tax=Aplysia californica TaxID=6500 RepID=A0ABM1W237_APLCA|nr:solute carrier family 23 member 1 [Aplysia californica]